MSFGFSGSMPFIIEAGEFISSGSKPFIVEAGELIKYNFQSTLWEFCVEAMIPLPMKSSIILMSHDLSQPIRVW